MSESLKQQWPEVVAAGLTGYMQGKESKMQREWMQLQKDLALSEEEHRKKTRPLELERQQYDTVTAKIQMIAAQEQQDQHKTADAFASSMAPMLAQQFGLPPEMAGQVKNALTAQIMTELGGAMSAEGRAQKQEKRLDEKFPLELRAAMNAEARSAIELLNAKDEQAQRKAMNNIAKSNYEQLKKAFPGETDEFYKENANAMTYAAAQEAMVRDQQMQSEGLRQKASRAQLKEANVGLEAKQLELQNQKKFGELQQAANVMATAGPAATETMAESLNAAVGRNVVRAPQDDKILKGMAAQHEILEGLVKANPGDPSAVQAWRMSLENIMQELGKYGGVDTNVIREVATNARPDTLPQLSTQAHILQTIHGMSFNNFGQPVDSPQLQTLQKLFSEQWPTKKADTAADPRVIEANRAFQLGVGDPELASRVVAEGSIALTNQNMTLEQYKQFLQSKLEELSRQKGEMRLKGSAVTNAIGAQVGRELKYWNDLFVPPEVGMIPSEDEFKKANPWYNPASK